MSRVGGVKPGSKRMSKAYLKNVLSKEDFEKYLKYHASLVASVGNKHYWKGWKESTDLDSRPLRKIKKQIGNLIWDLAQFKKDDDQFNEKNKTLCAKLMMIENEIEDNFGSRL